jgi:hypothetical protein
MRRTKIQDALSFPLELDMAPYLAATSPELHVDGEQRRPVLYDLYSILCHMGNAHAGHYFAYIFDAASARWLKFDDSNVTEVSVETALAARGGSDSANASSFSSPITAYMLCYRRRLDRAGAPIVVPQPGPDDIPEDVRAEERAKAEAEQRAYLLALEKEARERDSLRAVVAIRRSALAALRPSLGSAELWEGLEADPESALSVPREGGPGSDAWRLQEVTLSRS